ncbi:MAG: hypothetical protein IKJ65_12265 [Clostridia bacterium]|nr:hypothetical protein [Clostridia bacterium]
MGIVNIEKSKREKRRASIPPCNMDKNIDFGCLKASSSIKSLFTQGEGFWAAVLCVLRLERALAAD